MNTLPLFKIAGVVSRPLFVYMPRFYFKLYSYYKKISDREKITLLTRYIKPQDIVLDIGAHIGFYTEFLAKLVGEGGEVYAFEPAPENFQFLLKTTKSLSQVHPIHAAVGFHQGTIPLYISSVLNVDHRTYEVQDGRMHVSVPQVDLDHFSFPPKKIAFIKMDIQGSEFQALQGMTTIIQRDRPPVLTELWPWGLKRAGSSAQAVLSFFKNNRYEVNLIDERKGSRRIFDSNELVESESSYYDVLCVPQ